MALSTGQKAGWGLADMGIVVFVVVKQLLILTFMTSFLGVPIEIAGAVTTGILLFDMITDPVIGYMSDKTQSRFGRRAPWMFLGAIVMAMGMAGIFMAPANQGVSAAVLWVSVAFVVATVGFTMVSIPYGAMAGEITQDPKERSAMTGWRMAFASIGILVGGAVIPGLAQGMGYAMASVVVTPLIIGAIWLSIFATRNAPKIMMPSTANPIETLRHVFSNRAFTFLAALYGVMTFAIALITAGLPFAALYLIVDGGDTMLSGAAKALSVLSLMFAAFVVGSILSQAFWVFLSGRMGKVGALAFGLFLYLFVLYGLYSVLPATNVTLIAGMFILAGMTNGSYQQIPWAIYPDLMDVTRRETGEAIEGAFSAIWLFGQKAANAIAPLVLSLILGAYGWQETTEGKVDQLPEAVNALQVSITLVPAAVLGLSILALLFIYRPMARRILG